MTKLSMSEEEMLKRKYTRPYEKRIEDLEKENAELKDLLTKAKEIIKDQKELLDRVLSGAETLSDFAQNTLRKAEQFLKEIEK